MARALRRTVDQMVNDMDLSRVYRADLIKELTGSYEKRLSDQGETTLLRNSLYYWWWAYMQANLYLERQGLVHDADPDIWETRNHFGDPSLPFAEWWTSGGRHLFELQGHLPLIEVMDIDRDVGPDEFPEWITLKIPLTIRPEGIREQLDKILKICHPLTGLNPHRFADTIIKIYPKNRYRRDKYGEYLEIWKAVQADLLLPEPDRRDWWKIGRDLKINPGLDPDGESILSQEEKTELGEHAERLYNKAVQIMDGAIRGIFPRYD